MGNVVDMFEFKRKKQQIESAIDSAIDSAPNWMVFPWYKDDSGHPADLSCRCVITTPETKWATRLVSMEEGILPHWQLDEAALMDYLEGNWSVNREDLVEDQSFTEKLKRFLERKIWNGV